MENLQTKSEKQYYIPMEVNETSKEFFIANGVMRTYGIRSQSMAAHRSTA